MGTIANMPPIFRLRAFLAAHSERCSICRKAPKQAAFEGYCSEDCLGVAVQQQAF
jgi:hypothetical protein